MKPAECRGCGETVLSLLHSSFKLTFTAQCQACGRKVRKRGGWAELFAALIFTGLVVYASSVSSEGAWIWSGAAVFLFYMEWWSWRSVPWDVDEPEPDTQ